MEGYQERIAIKSDGITRFPDASEIDWIEAAAVYVIVQIEALSHGEFAATTKHGGRLRVSRTFRSLLERRLAESLQGSADFATGSLAVCLGVGITAQQRSRFPGPVPERGLAAE